MKHSIQLIIGAIACFGFVTGAYAHYTYTCPKASDFKMVKGNCIAKEHNTVFYTPTNPGGKMSGSLCSTPTAKSTQMVIEKKTTKRVVIYCHYDNGFYAYTKKWMKTCFSPKGSGGVWKSGTKSCTCDEPGCTVKCAIKS